MNISQLKTKYPNYKTWCLKPLNLKQMSFNNASVIRLDNLRFLLISYGQVAAAIIKDKVYLMDKQLLTQTTLKHIREFMLQFKFKISDEGKNDYKKYLYSHYTEVKDIESLI